MTDADLRAEIEQQRALMIAVSTGGPRIQEVNQEYTERRYRIRDALVERHMEDPNPYTDLWAWYGKWSSGDLPSYQSRRMFISELYQALQDAIGSHQGNAVVEPTGWARVDRDLGAMRSVLVNAHAEPDFQTVGLRCREILISLAQEVYNRDRHRPMDGVEPSSTDAKRMLEAYIATELAGNINEAARRHAKAALDLANDLQHKRDPQFRDAALCAEATSAVVNLIAIISGRRDPQ